MVSHALFALGITSFDIFFGDISWPSFPFRTYEKYTDELDFEVEISVKEIKRLVKELQNSINLSIELSDEGKNSEVSFLREALVFRNLGLEDIEKESISRKEEER